MKYNSINKYLPATGKGIESVEPERIKVSEKLRCDINHEDDPLIMLEKSLLCIYCLTGDKVFYEQNREKLIRFIT